MAREMREGGLSIFESVGPRSLAKEAAILTGSFFLFQMMTVELIKDGKIGAGQVRADKIKAVMAWGIR